MGNTAELLPGTLDLLILKSVSLGKLHGYAVLARIERLNPALNAFVTLTAEQAKIARQAYRDYGRGSGHPANLNFGDCFSYALAAERREPLLFVGDDFGHTDIRSAV